MIKSIFKIDKMDCPSEEILIRNNLQIFPNIFELKFDLNNRLLEIIHDENSFNILSKIDELNLGSTLLSENEANPENKNSTITDSEKHKQKSILIKVLVINAFFFVLEIMFGIISNSMGLVADSLDMFADASVYGISLFAIGGSLTKKKSIAKLIGYFQLSLATFGFLEIIRRFLATSLNVNFKIMIVISVLALLGNILSLYLFQKQNSNEVHMKASQICTSNDVIVNSGVIIAAILVSLLNSNLPDLIVGTFVFIIVFNSSLRIIKLGKN